VYLLQTQIKCLDVANLHLTVKCWKQEVTAGPRAPSHDQFLPSLKNAWAPLA